MDAYPDLPSALLDVRKAYRLIWLYQRRVVDIIKLITDALGYRFYTWDTEHSVGRIPGARTTDPFGEGKWIWATLPLYRMSLLYLPTTLEPNVQKKGQWMLEIFVEADTGFPKEAEDPAPTEFAEQSETVLRLFAWHCSQDGNLDWFNIWNGQAWPEQGDGVIEHAKAPIRIVRKSFELSKLPDRASVESALEEFKRVLSDKLLPQVTGAPPDDPAPASGIRLRG